MKKSKARRGLVAALGTAMVAGALIVGCSATNEAKPPADEGQEPVAADSTSMAAWRDAHPAEYYSFVNGTDSAKGAGVAAMDGDGVKGHGKIMDTLIYSMQPCEDPAYATNWDKKWDNTFPQDNTCLACKTTKFNDMVAQDGWMAQLERYDLDSLSETDMWDCMMCHADINDPAASLGARGAGFQRVGGSLLEGLDPKEVLCAQCHTATGFWLDGINDGKLDLDSDVEIDPYKYGTDPGSMLKLLKEYADEDSKRYIDKDHGIYIYLSFTEPHHVETFHGSVMDESGLDCTSCHMPSITEADGATFTSHDASGSPLDNMSSLKSCLNCHKASDDIQSVAEMQAFVGEAQDRFDARKAELQTKLDGLKDAIIAADEASADQATLDAARQAYADATAYHAYTRPSVVHNPTTVYEWLDEEEKIIDDAMELLK